MDPALDALSDGASSSDDRAPLLSIVDEALDALCESDSADGEAPHDVEMHCESALDAFSGWLWRSAGEGFLLISHWAKSNNLLTL